MLGAKATFNILNKKGDKDKGMHVFPNVCDGMETSIPG